MPVYTYRSFKSWGGRSSRGQWSNVYHVACDAPLDDAQIAAVATSIVNAEKTFHLANVSFMRVVISTFAKEGRSGHPEAVRSIEMAGVGDRPMPNGVDALPLDVAFVVKTSGVTGRSGQYKYRGVLTEADVIAGGQGNFVLPGVPSWPSVANLEAMSTFIADAFFVFPANTPTGLPTRLVDTYAIGGVVVQKTRNKRKKKGAVSEGNALEYLDEVLAVAGLIASFYFTKGTTLAPIARLAASARLGSLAGIIGQVVQHLTELATGDPVTP